MPEFIFDASGMEALTRHMEEAALKVRAESDMAMPGDRRDGRRGGEA